MVTITIEAPVNPSEDAQKVHAAALRLFPDLVPSPAATGFRATSGSLDAFGKLLARQRILDAARSVLLGGMRADASRSTFTVSKQAATAGHVSFSVGDAPLGDFTVTVEADDLEALLKRIAPRTRRGFPISEEEAERLEARDRQLRASRKNAVRRSKDDGAGDDEDGDPWDEEE